jgi:hypothetical protein
MMNIVVQRLNEGSQAKLAAHFLALPTVTGHASTAE